MTVPFLQPSFPNPPPSFPSSLSPTPLDAHYAGQFKCKRCEWTAGSCYGTKSPFFLYASVNNVGHLCGIACCISYTEPVLFSLRFFCCCNILIYLSLCNLDTEFSSSELTLSRIESVLFLRFFCGINPQVFRSA